MTTPREELQQVLDKLTVEVCAIRDATYYTPVDPPPEVVASAIVEARWALAHLAACVAVLGGSAQDAVRLLDGEQ
jgi:hypothetical protein